MTSKRVCVIGAGPSGLAFLYQMKKMEAGGKPIPEVVCFEQQLKSGGLWTYDKHAADRYGDEMQSSMYENLWNNTCKEILEYPDYSFEKHYGQVLPSFLPRPLILDYLKGRNYSAGDLDGWIRYNTRVNEVVFDEGKFTVTTVTKGKKEDDVHSFDYVIVATGHFSKPNMPDFEGLSTFAGQVLHAKCFHNARRFKGKKILLIGSSFTAIDIAIQCCKYGSGPITISHRRAPLRFGWTESITEKPLVTKIDKTNVTFRDESSDEFDVIILCTGYLHNFPFMAEELRLKTNNVFYPKDLYKGVVFLGGGHYNLFYMGMQNQSYSFTMFDIQAIWIAKKILGEISIPSRDEMIIHGDKWIKKNNTLSAIPARFAFQTEYLKEICTDVGYKSELNRYQHLMDWFNNIAKNPFTSRDISYISLATSKASATHKTPFMETLEDPLLELIAK